MDTRHEIHCPVGAAVFLFVCFVLGKATEMLLGELDMSALLPFWRPGSGSCFHPSEHLRKKSSNTDIALLTITAFMHTSVATKIPWLPTFTCIHT